MIIYQKLFRNNDMENLHRVYEHANSNIPQTMSDPPIIIFIIL